jgi:hypothetical protein
MRKDREKSRAWAAVRGAAGTVKIMALVLWHALRYPVRESVVDYDTKTVRLADADE